MIPAASCITIYPWHGIREYTPRTISKITQLFGVETDYHLFSLGDSECNKLHRKFITWPNLRYGVDLRHTENQKYMYNLKTAILNDFRNKVNQPSFYALVLASNFQEVLYPTEN
jgi:hypothetical protein